MLRTKQSINPKRYQYQRTPKTVKKNTCHDCPVKLAPGVKYCTECFLKHKARKYLGNANRWKVLRKIYDQQKGKCAYTGVKITLGRDCTLDHIVSKAKGGKNQGDNFQWVLGIVNAMKGNLTEAEFLTIIKQIFNYKIRR